MLFDLPVLIGPSYQDIVDAARRIKPFIKHTPVMTSISINNLTGSTIFFKCENLQTIGAFKFRGATNAVRSLSENDLANGVATHSSGNHAAALALAAKMRNIKATIVMPSNAPSVKVAAVQSYGGDIVFCKPTLQAREEVLSTVIQTTGAIFIPPYNYCPVIAGQGTAALEFLEEINELDFVITPVGGGGLLSGTSIATSVYSPRTQIIGAEPLGADDAFRSFNSKKLIKQQSPNTIADGLLTSLGDITFSIILRYVSTIYTAQEKTIIDAMRMIWERMKIIVEPSSAVALAIVIENAPIFKDKRVGIILSGGNLDLKKLPWQ